jgi:LmbE family N-acetylglucosaminyl deacetylase
MLVISPHLDDAVLSCGQLLASHPGSTVITVFAGTPQDGQQATDWDGRCGFRNAAEAMQARRREDETALALLGARPHWLGFCDSQYGITPRLDDLSDALQAALLDLLPDVVLYPLGLFHSDHLLVHDAATAALAALTGALAFAYEDVPYRGRRSELQQRLAALASGGICATPARLHADGSDALKARAVQAYASQLHAFGAHGLDDAAMPERCWRLEPMAAHREGDAKP